MSDNVAVTAGVGTSIATDDLSGVHYQRMKMGIGADGKYSELQPVTFSGTTGTVDATIVNTSGILFGCWAFSTSGAAAEVRIHDSTSASTGACIWGAVFDGSTGSRNNGLWMGPQGVKFNSGLRVERTAGTVRVSLYYIAPA